MSIKVPKEREVPFGAITPAPVNEQELFITSNWRIMRPVIDNETCTRCFTCYISCPDSAGLLMKKKNRWNGTGSTAKAARSAFMSARSGP